MPRRTLIPAVLVIFAAGACGRSKPVGVTPDAAAGTGGASDGPPFEAAQDGAEAAQDGAEAAQGGAEAAQDGAEAAQGGGTLTAKLVKAIALPGMPTISTYNAGTKKAYFACQTAAKASAGVAVVDDEKNAVISTIMLTGPVTGLAANATTKMVYASERDQVDVIDGATDTVTAMVKTPDGALITGLAVDETHNLVYAAAGIDTVKGLYVLDAATNTLRFVRSVLLNPAGVPPIAVDAAMQLVFILGADSNGAGELVAFDGVSGTPQKLATSDSLVSASASGIVALGDGKAAALLLGPNILKGLYQPDADLPAGFTPTGITAAAAAGGGRYVILVGFDANGGSQVLVIDPVSGLPSSTALALGGAAVSTTVAAGVLAAAPIAGGTELYVDEEDPKSNPPSGPAETLKIELTTTPAP